MELNILSAETQNLKPRKEDSTDFVKKFLFNLWLQRVTA